MVLLVLVILVFGSGVSTYLIRSVSDWSQRRDASARRRQELESRERQLKLLPDIISAYLGVTQDQAKADELSALLVGMVNGPSANRPEHDVTLHEKLDHIIALLEEEWEEEEEEEEESPSDQLRLQIEREHTLRVNAVLAHVRETSRPSPQELRSLLEAVQPLERERSTGVRIDSSAVHTNGTVEDRSAQSAQKVPEEVPAKKAAREE